MISFSQPVMTVILYSKPLRIRHRLVTVRRNLVQTVDVFRSGDCLLPFMYFRKSLLGFLQRIIISFGGVFVVKSVFTYDFVLCHYIRIYSMSYPVIWHRRWYSSREYLIYSSIVPSSRMRKNPTSPPCLKKAPRKKDSGP